MPCACWIAHFLCEGRRGWWADGWTVQLLTAVYHNAEAQAARPQAWVHWLPAGQGARGWRFHGGLN